MDSLPAPALGAVPSAEGASPALAQWFAAKAQHPDALLFFRMGDFFELFFADAEAASEALGLALSFRGEHRGERVPMCGVPAHAHEAYLARLIRRGFRVAICEQMETPEEAKKRKAATLRREVVRLVTPGTVTEDALLEAARPAWLLALAPGEGGTVGAAWLDVSTGAFETEALPAVADLPGLLARLEPAELLAPPDLAAVLPGLAGRAGDGSGAAARRGRAGRGGLRRVHPGRLRHLRRRRDRRGGDGARLRQGDAARRGRGAGASLAPGAARRAGRAADGRRDAAQPGDPAERARRHARLPARRGGPHGDGGRRRGSWPRASPARSRRRSRSLPGTTRWRRCSLRRGCGTRCAKRCAARPTWRARWGGSRSTASRRATWRRSATGSAAPPRSPTRSTLPAMRCRRCLREAAAALRPEPDPAPELTRALAETLPARLDDPGLVAVGYDGQLDGLRRLRDDARGAIAAMQLDLAQAWGVASLKVRHHQQFGYLAEVPAAAGEKLLREAPATAGARAGMAPIHRQTMANGHRFTCAALADLDRRLAEAGDAAAQARARGRAAPARPLPRAPRRASRRPPLPSPRWTSTPPRRRSRRRTGGAGRRSWIGPISRSAAGRHPVVAAALARERRRRCFRAERLRPFAGAPRLPAHRAEHGGQIHVPPAERADGRACAGGDVRARRGGAARPRGPAVLPRRRGGRHRRRALHLHGGDGGDRRHPEPGGAARAWWCWTRSGAAPRPGTGWRWPGRCWKRCTTGSAAAPSSPPTSMS